MGYSHFFPTKVCANSQQIPFKLPPGLGLAADLCGVFLCFGGFSYSFFAPYSSSLFYAPDVSALLPFLVWLPCGPSVDVTAHVTL